jgi:hypothetical protein
MRMVVSLADGFSFPSNTEPLFKEHLSPPTTQSNVMKKLVKFQRELGYKASSWIFSFAAHAYRLHKLPWKTRHLIGAGNDVWLCDSHTERKTGGRTDGQTDRQTGQTIMHAVSYWCTQYIITSFDVFDMLPCHLILIGQRNTWWWGYWTLESKFKARKRGGGGKRERDREHKHWHSFTHSLTHLLTHSPTYSLTHSLTYSLTHSLTH